MVRSRIGQTTGEKIKFKSRILEKKKIKSYFKNTQNWKSNLKSI